jgi:hypothetical protein
MIFLLALTKMTAHFGILQYSEKYDLQLATLYENMWPVESYHKAVDSTVSPALTMTS